MKGGSDAALIVAFLETTPSHYVFSSRPMYTIPTLIRPGKGAPAQGFLAFRKFKFLGISEALFFFLGGTASYPRFLMHDSCRSLKSSYRD
jgi:hypothetical protein